MVESGRARSVWRVGIARSRPACRDDRAREKYPPSAELGQAAGVHDRDAIGDMRDDGEIV